jgi:hypothetical protein
MPRTRRPNFTADQKLQVLRLHLLEKRPASDLCDEFGFRPSQFHEWQKQFFENGAAAFARRLALRTRVVNPPGGGGSWCFISPPPHPCLRTVSLVERGSTGQAHGGSGTCGIHQRATTKV